MVQVLDYINVRDTLQSILQTANTTTATYDLSNSLTARIKTVSVRDENIEPFMITEYPIINVRLNSKSEEFAEFGAGIADRNVLLSSQIFCIYDSGSKSDNEDNLWKMVRNVETNVRRNLDLNSYNTSGALAVSVNPVGVEFIDNIDDESPYNRSARIDVDIQFHLKDV